MDRPGRIGKRNSKNKRRPIVVKLIYYNDHREIFHNKKQKVQVFLLQEPSCWQNAKEINLALMMCDQLMEESCRKIVPVQNQKYFTDKW